MNNDPLRSSISIIIMIMISVLINCIHFAVTVLHMHTDSVWGNSMQDLNTAEGLQNQRERLCLMRDNRMQDSRNTSVSWNMQNLADFSKDFSNQRASYCRSPRVYTVQCVENRKSFQLVTTHEAETEEKEGKDTASMIQFIQRAPRSQVTLRSWFNLNLQ